MEQNPSDWMMKKKIKEIFIFGYIAQRIQPTFEYFFLLKITMHIKFS